jgi:hypothetical protein
MGRHRCHVYVNDRSPRYIVLWSIQWEMIDCRYIEAGSDRYATAPFRNATRELSILGKKNW